MGVRFDKEKIEHIALLARLDLSGEEMAAMQGHMNKMLDYVEKLSELDTEGVVPSPFAMELTNVFREDVPVASILPEEALQNAPERAEGGFKVPQVLE